MRSEALRHSTISTDYSTVKLPLCHHATNYLKGTYWRCNSMSFFTAGLHIVLRNYQQGSYFRKLGFTVDFFKYKKKTPLLSMDNQQQGRVYTLYSISSNFIYAHFQKCLLFSSWFHSNEAKTTLHSSPSVIPPMPNPKSSKKMYHYFLDYSIYYGFSSQHSKFLIEFRKICDLSWFRFKVFSSFFTKNEIKATSWRWWPIFSVFVDEIQLF